MRRNSEINNAKGGPTKRGRDSREDVVREACRGLKQSLERLSVGLLMQGEMLGREQHVRQILQFLQSDAHRTLLLFGMPGTGKTCSVKQALARMPEDSFTAILLNGYVVQRPADIYRTICQHLTRTRLGHEEVMRPEDAATLLEKRFRTQGWGSNPRTSTRLCVILIDEMDKCVEKNPKVLYRLVEWLSMPYAYCKLIGIANSMEFPMDAKTKSRLDSSNQMVFQPYTEKELLMILKQRLETVSCRFRIITDRAMEYVCRQTASQCGDVRRLLQATANAAHGLLCALEEGEASLQESEAVERGVLDFRHVHAVVSRVFQERFRDFVLGIKSPVLFVVVCVITVETRRCEAMVGTSVVPCLGLHVVQQHTISCVDAYGTRLGLMDGGRDVAASRWLLLHHLKVLKEVGFVDVASQPQGSLSDSASSAVMRTPLSSVSDILETDDDIVITMTQLPDVVLTMCEVHEPFGSIMRPYLTTSA